MCLRGIPIEKVLGCLAGRPESRSEKQSGLLRTANGDGSAETTAKPASLKKRRLAVSGVRLGSVRRRSGARQTSERLGGLSGAFVKTERRSGSGRGREKRRLREQPSVSVADRIPIKPRMKLLSGSVDAKRNVLQGLLRRRQPRQQPTGRGRAVGDIPNRRRMTTSIQSRSVDVTAKERPRRTGHTPGHRHGSRSIPTPLRIWMMPDIRQMRCRILKTSTPDARRGAQGGEPSTKRRLWKTQTRSAAERGGSDASGRSATACLREAMSDIAADETLQRQQSRRLGAAGGGGLAEAESRMEP
jgi:hypothetical protein